MTNQQGAPEALDDLYLKLHGLSKRLEGSGLIDEDDAPEAYPAILAAMNLVWRLQREQSAALVEAKQPATHVQNPVGIEHVAGDVSKNGPESNMAQQPAPSAAAAEHYDEVRTTLTGLHALCENISAMERRVGPLGSHARGYTHKITAALRHLDALATAPTPQTDSQPAPVPDSKQVFATTMRRIYGNEFPSDGAFAGEHGWSNEWAIFQAGMAAARAPADSVTAPAGGWHPFPHYLQNPDGRLLRTSADLLERHGYTGCSTPLRRMADALLNEPPAPTTPAQAPAVAVPLTDEMTSKAGRALSDLYATECGIDKEDNWKVYGSDFIETAKLVLAAAHGIKGGQHGAE